MNVRKIKRNMMKNEQGNNRIGKAWRRKQVNKYGLTPWLCLYRACVGQMTQGAVFQ